jgi:ATP-dependent 26S proteasome regulatory subunit
MKRVVVIAATNAPQAIDSAFLRPGRFDRVVPIPPPDATGTIARCFFAQHFSPFLLNCLLYSAPPR